MRDGWLLICFIGEPATNRAQLPRVAVWRSGDAFEEVDLSPSSRQLLAALAVPPLRFSAASSPRDDAEQLAATLARPLPERSTDALMRATGEAPSSLRRHRGKLQRELAAHGLGHRLQVRRGAIVPNGITSDIAELVGLTSGGDWAGAMRLFAALGDGDPRRLRWLLPEPWPARARPAVQEALTGIKQRGLSDGGTDRPTATPEPESVAVLDESHARADAPLTSGRWLPARLAHGTEIVAVAPPALPWRPLPPLRRRRRRRWLAAAAAAGAAVIAAGAALLSTGGGPDEDVLALSWPLNRPDFHAYLLNVTRDLGLGPSIPALDGDELLVRARIAPAPAPRRGMWVYEYRSSDRVPGISIAVPFEGRTAWTTLYVDARKQLRAQWMPGSTVLRDGTGKVVRRLPDMRDRSAIDLGTIPAGRTFYVDARLRYALPAVDAPGQIEAATIVCREKRPGRHRQTGWPPSFRRGARLACEAPVENLGPNTLESVVVRFAPTTGDGYIRVSVATEARQGEPRSVWLTAAFPLEGRGRVRARLVPRSLAVLDPQTGQQQLWTDESFARGVDVGEIPPGQGGAVHLSFDVVVR